MPLHVGAVSWGFPCLNNISATLPFLSRMLPACAFSHSSLSRPSNFLRRKLRIVAQLCCTGSRSGIIVELLGEGLHGGGLVYISSQLVHLALWASFLIHTSSTQQIQSLSFVRLIFMIWLNCCPDFELFGKCPWKSLLNCTPRFS